ncbi:MAG: hypothetical protein M0Q42_08155 [Xanthomonadales bacterium]|nr:hypothetical protein [Xanthomonadales bacterium]
MIPAVKLHPTTVKASGTRFEAWLSEHGRGHRLGTDIAELDQRWNTWLGAQL